MNAIKGRQNAPLGALFFSMDGSRIFFGDAGRIGSIPVGSAEEPKWLTDAGKLGAVVSPDGKWLTYSSVESDRLEIFVSPFPNVNDDRRQISREGGGQPLWSRDGKELFYVEGTALPAPLMVATAQTDGGKFTVVARKPVWNSTPPYFTTVGGAIFRTYDLSPDGQRFIVLKDLKPPGAADAPEQIFIVQNWTEELKRRVPGAGK